MPKHKAAEVFTDGEHMNVLSACALIINSTSKYCVICFRTETERKLRPSKSLQSLLSHMNKDEVWSLQAMPLENALLCYMCEARASSAACLVRAVLSALGIGRLLVHCRKFPSDLQRLGQILKGIPVSSPLAHSVVSSDKALRDTRHFTILEHTITQMLATDDSPNAEDHRAPVVPPVVSQVVTPAVLPRRPLKVPVRSFSAPRRAAGPQRMPAPTTPPVPQPAPPLVPPNPDPLFIPPMPAPMLDIEVKEESDIETYIIDDDDDVVPAPAPAQSAPPAGAGDAHNALQQVPVPASTASRLSEQTTLSIAAALKAGLSHFILPDIDGKSLLAVNTPAGDLVLHQLMSGSDGCLYAPTLPARIRNNQLEYINDGTTLLLQQTTTGTTPTVQPVINHFVSSNIQPETSDSVSQTRRRQSNTERNGRAASKRVRTGGTGPGPDSDGSGSDWDGTGSAADPDGTSRVQIQGMTAKQAQAAWSASADGAAPVPRLKGDNIDWEDKIPDNVIAYLDS